MSERVSRRHTQMISSVRLPTALVAAPTSVLNCQRRHCQRRPSILRYACIFGQAIEQALAIMQSCSSFNSSKSTSPPITTWYQIARVHSAGSKASRHALASAPDVNQMVFFKNRPEPPHMPTHHAENGHGHLSAWPSPTIHRLILLRQGRPRHCEGRSLRTRARTSWQAEV